MTSREISTSQVFFTLVLAAVFWYLIFSAQLFNFWLSMAVAASVLAGLAVFLQGPPVAKKIFMLIPCCWVWRQLSFFTCYSGWVIPFPSGCSPLPRGKSILFIKFVQRDGPCS